MMMLLVVEDLLLIFVLGDRVLRVEMLFFFFG